jgi:hypothetical protein
VDSFAPPSTLKLPPYKPGVADEPTLTVNASMMVTLTGVGYGGIVPANPYVRMVAALESMCGISFVAVVVARLVSSYNPKRGSLGRSRHMMGMF